jgi:hypothetical protein
MRQEQVRMGKEQLDALAKIIAQQMDSAEGNPLIGTWTVEYNKERQVFYFGKCEFGGYCEERPTVISLTGEVIDRGGPLIRA